MYQNDCISLTITLRASNKSYLGKPEFPNHQPQLTPERQNKHVARKRADEKKLALPAEHQKGFGIFADDKESDIIISCFYKIVVPKTPGDIYGMSMS